MQIDTKVRFILSVPDWKPKEATPFQGFSLSLCENSKFLRFIRLFPTDIFEYTVESLPSRIARRIAGQLPVQWFGQSPRAIKSGPIPIQMAFTVIILDESENFSEYREWLEQNPGPVTIIAKDGGHITYDKLSYASLRARFLEICTILKAGPEVIGVDDVQRAIEGWAQPEERKLTYKLGGHGSIGPNLAALQACGFGSLVEGPFDQLGNEEAYINQIVGTCATILDEREANPSSEANRIFPRTPDLNFYLPGTYDLKAMMGGRQDLDQKTRKELTLALRLIERQDSYSFDITSLAQIKAIIGRTTEELEAGASPIAHPVFRTRQLEINLGTEAVSCLAASEISSVIRLPNRMNRTKGIVRGFAQHYRADKPQMLKRAELFRRVQQAIGSGFPAPFFDILDRSVDGVRVIGDAHVEWLNVRGIPLGLRYDVSRIPVTPGNLFIETIGPQPPIYVTPGAFNEVLVVSGLAEKDVIAKIFKIAFDHFGELWQENIELKFVRVSSRQEMVDAINAFEGMLMIFDGHGSHKNDEPGVLWLGDEPVDVWGLRGEITRAPPIVMLSACDTHAADRNHATVANGFLSLGTRSVIGSVFPLHATHAAIFAARLLYRVSKFIPAAVGMFNRSITWLEVVSGMLRRQALTDILRHFEMKGLLPDGWTIDQTTELQMMVDVSGRDPFANVQAVIAKWDLPPGQADREIHSALANSSTISYLHLGRPETILINSVSNMERFFAEDESGRKTDISV